MPQFNSNFLQNPRMNKGAESPNWWNPSSPVDQWENQWQPNSTAWEDAGEQPGSYGGSSWYNPRTGQTSRQTNDVSSGYYGDRNSIYSTDPNTGKKYINFDLLTGMLDGEGGGGYKGYETSEYGGRDVTPGAGYEAFDYDTIGSGIDPGAVIAAQEYGLQESMEADMARAGARAGASGFAMSTPYMGELGAAARKAAQDRNALTMKYQFEAAENQAARDLAQQQQAASLDFGGWQTGYQGDLTAQMSNAERDYRRWATENQIGLSNTQGENLYNQQNQQNRQSFMQQILGMIGGLGG